MTAPTGRTLSEQMRAHAGDSRHLYGELMRRMADDWDAGGPTREILLGWEDAPAGWVVQLRILAGLFRIVLTGRAPELEPFYPCLGGDADPALAWPLVRRALAANVRELHDALEVAPQTNEVGRSNALLVGIFRAVERTGLRRIRLLEPGCSAGLNLLIDEFRFVNSDWSFGPESSPVQLLHGIEGTVRPEAFAVVDRRGCDLSPVDATTDEGRLRLRSFVWPFQVARHERLAGALQLADSHAPPVDRSSAADWLAERLAEPVGRGTLTVVWQSITGQYWPAAESSRVTQLIDGAAAGGAVAHVSMEYPVEGLGAGARLTVGWPDRGSLNRETLGTVGDHGFPVRLTR